MDKSNALTGSKTQSNRQSIYIYGAGQRGRALLSLIKNYYDGEISVEGYIDRAAVGTVEGYPVYRLSELQDKTAKIIIAVAAPYSAKEIHQTLQMAGFYDHWWCEKPWRRKVYRDFFSEQCISCQEWGDDTLVSVDIYAMDACNLNCVGCTHFAPIFEMKIPDTQSRLDDVRKLREKIPHVEQFSIVGGEPFLNPDICSYLEIKNIYPRARVTVVTNGLPLIKTPGEVFERLRDENVHIAISEYEPTNKCMDKIQQILERYDLVYSLLENKGKFNLPLSFTRGEKYCISHGCVGIWNGKIARCPPLMYITEFNKYFKTTFPEEGILSLEEPVSGKELVELLEREVPLCSYCGHHEVDWGVCGKDVTVDKFVSII